MHLTILMVYRTQLYYIHRKKHMNLLGERTITLLKGPIVIYNIELHKRQNHRHEKTRGHDRGLPNG